MLLLLVPVQQLLSFLFTLMEKMSVCKPAKQAKMNGQSQVQRSETPKLVMPRASITREGAESDLLTSSHQQPTPQMSLKRAIQAHPKGHKVRMLKEVWDTMDSQAFLHLTDTIVLADVWVKPISVEPTTSIYADATFEEIVLAPHIKNRIAKTRIAIDDLINMLYMCDCLAYEFGGETRPEFDDWISLKTASFIKANGVSDATNRSKLCNYILREDPDFSFYPSCLKTNAGIYFRKICYHSYKEETSKSGEDDHKFINPSMMKCVATRGKFEYIIEARIVPLPGDYFHQRDEANHTTGEMEEFPESQAMDGSF